MQTRLSCAGRLLCSSDFFCDSGAAQSNANATEGRLVHIALAPPPFQWATAASGILTDQLGKAYNTWETINPSDYVPPALPTASLEAMDAPLTSRASPLSSTQANKVITKLLLAPPRDQGPTRSSTDLPTTTGLRRALPTVATTTRSNIIVDTAFKYAVDTDYNPPWSWRTRRGLHLQRARNPRHDAKNQSPRKRRRVQAREPQKSMMQPSTWRRRCGSARGATRRILTGRYLPRGSATLESNESGGDS